MNSAEECFDPDRLLLDLERHVKAMKEDYDEAKGESKGKSNTISDNPAIQAWDKW